MPSGSYRQIYVICPFYRWDDGKKRITCEGVVEQSSIAQIFHNKEDYEQHISIFCSGCYEKCEIAQTLMKFKYEEG